MTLREEIAELIDLSPDCDTCNVSCSDKFCNRKLYIADSIINRLSELGYGKMVGCGCSYYKDCHLKKFQPIERSK